MSVKLIKHVVKYIKFIYEFLTSFTSYLFQKRGDSNENYQKYTVISDMFGYLLLLGLLVELVFAFVIDKPFIEKYSTILSDIMIAVGVLGELKYGRVARVFGDAAQAEAVARTKEAESRAAEALLKAAEADLARVDLAAKIAPRRLTLEQASLLQSELKERIPPLYIRSLGGSETRQYAQDFLDALASAGLIETDESSEQIPLDGGPFERLSNLGFALSESHNWRTGVQVYIPSSIRGGDTSEKDPLAVALKKAGVTVGHVWSSDEPDPAVTIPQWKAGRRILIVGEKPLIAL